MPEDLNEAEEQVVKDIIEEEAKEADDKKGDEEDSKEEKVEKAGKEDIEDSGKEDDEPSDKESQDLKAYIEEQEEELKQQKDNILKSKDKFSELLKTAKDSNYDLKASLVKDPIAALNKLGFSRDDIIGILDGEAVDANPLNKLKLQKETEDLKEEKKKALEEKEAAEESKYADALKEYKSEDREISKVIIDHYGVSSQVAKSVVSGMREKEIDFSDSKSMMDAIVKDLGESKKDSTPDKKADKKADKKTDKKADKEEVEVEDNKENRKIKEDIKDLKEEIKKAKGFEKAELREHLGMLELALIS